jgi:hypothetical protein
MDQGAITLGVPGMQRLLQGIQNELCVHAAAHAPPAMRRACTSITKATYSQTCQV